MRSFVIVKRSLVRCLMLLLVGLLSSACRKERPDEAELVILYTSDVMNYSLPYDFLKKKPSEVSLANFATYAKEVRSEYGSDCIVLDNGNKILGTVPSGYYNYIDTVSEPLAFRAERLIGYDAVGIGDKDLHVPVILNPKRWNPQNQPPIVCANLINSKTGDPIFQPYIEIERNGFLIVVLGMVSPNVLSWVSQEDRVDVDVEDMIECASKWMPAIKKLNPDLVIGLCGASLNYQEHGCTIDTYKNGNGSVPVAIRVPGFDLMLMGGSSEREVFEVRNDQGIDVTCVQTGTSCTHCGEVKVEFFKNSEGQYNKHISASIVDLKQYAPDKDYSNQFASVKDTLEDWLNEEIGLLGDTLWGAQGLYEADAYRQFINRAQLWFTGADISIASCVIGADTIVPGSITSRTLFKIYPFANQVELMELQGQDIVSLLEYASGLQFSTVRSAEDPLLALKRDRNNDVVYNDDGTPYLADLPRNFISANGIIYTIDVTKPVGQRIHVLSMADGSPFELRKNYKVAINSFIGKDGGQFFSKGLGWDQNIIELHAISRPQFSVRYAIQEYVRAMGDDPIHLQQDKSWKLVPEELVRPLINVAKKSALPIW